MSQEKSNDSALINHPTVFFDGVCGLCNNTVNWLLAHDANRTLRFSPLQGSTAEKLVSQQIRSRLDTFVFVKQGRTFTRSTAVVRILMTLGGRWRVLGWLLWIVPWPVRDIGYRTVSRLRYRVFGKHDSCRLPTPQERDMFLD